MSGSDPTRVRGREASRTGAQDPGGAETRVRSGAPASEADETLVRTGAPDRETSARYVAPLALQLPSAPAHAAEFAPGYRVRERYVLEELIGQGSMGQVWRARDEYAENLNYSSPIVALKVLNADFELNKDAYKALHREAAHGAGLGHPNIVDVQHFDVDQRTTRGFIVMELLQGQSLEDLLADTAPQGLPRERAMKLLRGMAAGLAHAHEKGIVHSDFKPANVFVTSDDVVKILDFGIARRVPAANADDSAQARDENVYKGYTLMYASPEAIVGSEANTAEDVFSLGVVAYQMVAGRHPFGRLSALEAREGGKPLPALRGLRRREAAAIMRALSFEPKDRFPDAGAFSKALQGVAPIQIALATLAVVLLIAAAGFWYRSYVASGPDIPFNQLPVAQQKAIQAALDDGGRAIDYLQRTQDISGSQDAAYSYARAYALQPRNRAAVAGLEHAADLAIDWYRKQPDRRLALEQLQLFRKKSDFYDTYTPLLDAIEDLQQP